MIPKTQVVKEPVAVQLRTSADVKRFLRKGVFDITAEVLRRENVVEARKRNFPSSMMIKTRGRLQRIPLTQEQSRSLARIPEDSFKVSGQFSRLEFRYVTKKDVVEAAVFIYRQLAALMNRRSGRAMNSVYFWVRDVDRNRTVGDFFSITAFQTVTQRLDNQGVNYSVNVVGPTVPYRRQLIYGEGRGQLSKLEQSRAIRRSAAGSKYLKDVNINRFVGYRKGQSLLETFEAARKDRTTKSGRTLVQYQTRNALHKLIVARARAKYPGVSMGYYSKPAHVRTAPDARGKSWPNDAKDRQIQGTFGHGFVPSIFVTGATRIDNKRA